MSGTSRPASPGPGSPRPSSGSSPPQRFCEASLNGGAVDIIPPSTSTAALTRRRHAMRRYLLAALLLLLAVTASPAQNRRRAAETPAADTATPAAPAEP